MSKKESNYWPHFIIALVLFAIALGIWTIKVAVDNPVELDNSYMMKYQDVDRNFYKIEQEKKEFDKRYSIYLKNRKLNVGKNRVVLFVKSKDDEKNIKNAKVEILLTRPETTKYDKKYVAKFDNGAYVADIEIPKEGRWNLIVKVTVGSISRFTTYKLSTRRVLSLQNT
jgi:hypothetical protein